MANFISLGRNCSVAHNIRKYANQNGPTHFFDWVRSDFKCVLHILKLKTIDTIFNTQNMIIDKETFKHEKKLTITLKNFAKDNLCLLFHHDVEYDKNDNDEQINCKLKDFFAKYDRRHNRLIKLIETSKKLCFIYFNDVNKVNNVFDYNDCAEFNKIITAINANLDYFLVLLMKDNYEEKDYKCIKTKNLLKINLKHFFIKNVVVDWTRNMYDWKSIFKLIQDNIK